MDSFLRAMCVCDFSFFSGDFADEKTTSDKVW